MAARFTGSIFNAVQSLGANLQILLVLLVPLRDASVEVPAAVIKARLAGKLFDFGA